MFARKTRFLAAVDTAVRRYHMLEPGDSVVVGVSGGPDSVALLHYLVALKPDWSLRLVIAHLNHQLRGRGSQEDAAFVQRLASRLEIPCEIGLEDVRSYSAKHRLSIQEAAREIRYSFYDTVAVRHAAGKIALGHQADDNAESVLIHLLRGTGSRGLAGIPPVRNSRIIRPLIDLTRAEILEFLKEHNLEYVQDRSNLNAKYVRNKIRHSLLPTLTKEFNPEAASAMTRLASIVREEEDFWRQRVEAAFKAVLLERSTDCVRLSTSGLARLHTALLRRLVRHAVFTLRGNLKRLGYNHVEMAVQLIKRPLPSGCLDLPYGVKVVRDWDETTFLLGQVARPWFEYHINGVGTTFIREIDMLFRVSVCDVGEVVDPGEYPATTGLFDLHAVSFPLTVRNVREGDRFRPLGMSGSQKVKVFFVNNKVCRSKRERCPIVISAGKIMWVGGYRINDCAKITDKTKKVLKAELFPA